MRRSVALIVVALLVASASVVFADEAVLIDFSLLGADIIEDPVQAGKLTQNRATMMDFSTVAGASYTEEQKKQMAISLAIENWDVILASSSRTGMRQALTYTREAKIAQDAKLYAGATALGIRVNFPLEPFNSWARIQPPFDVPAFEPKADIDDSGKITEKTDAQGADPKNAALTRFEGSYDAETKITTALGIVKNVGVIKSIAVNVKGLNFPHGLSVILKDNDGVEHVMFMGYLNFDGWRELRWDNPQYITDVRNRELRIDPLYPRSTPFVKFAGFLISRDAAAIGGDFIAYVKDVKILYDKAVLEPVRDIDDEAIWGIIGQKEDDRKRLESQRFGASQVMRYLERMKQETKTEFTGSGTSE
ncbi:MAG TPA: flagellar filament outer layer protein FlaA [Spirochaetia bacterium]|nr:flagellar protein [Spirochaetaceae bacterium]HPE88269.1 flagellar filament outer layer protein FlaA [Spirochaetales bacterium]HRW23060.1 flagellar filament outer layer protein FlaA [Spirochaetia bacterium]